MKIAKKFPEELKRVKLENELLGVCLDESNKLNVTLKKNFAAEVEKNKSLEQELAKSKAKHDKLSSNKLAIVTELVSKPPKPNDDTVYIPTFKGNHI